MRDIQSRQQSIRTIHSNLQEFPPRRDYVSLSVADLLEARETHHVQLASLENVVATAVGRYLIQERDWYAAHPSDQPPARSRPEDYAETGVPRTLANSVVRPWSWPAVLVFVRDWKQAQELGPNTVPKMLYLQDGRIIPTCVVLALPDEA